MLSTTGPSRSGPTILPPPRSQWADRLAPAAPILPAPPPLPSVAIVAAAWRSWSSRSRSVAPGALRIPHQLAETVTAATYSFILSDHRGTRYRWNPCAPIHYVENLDGASGSADDIRGALHRVSAATGITFVDDGPSDEIPTLHRPAFQPDRYGDEWAPILIAWVTPSQTDISFERNGETASGVASPQLPDDQTGEVYVSGWVAINASDLSPTGFSEYGRPGAGPAARAGSRHRDGPHETVGRADAALWRRRHRLRSRRSRRPQAARSFAGLPGDPDPAP